MLTRSCFKALMILIFSANLITIADTTEKNSGKDKKISVLAKSTNSKKSFNISMDIPVGWTCSQDELCKDSFQLTSNDLSAFGSIEIFPEASLSDKFLKETIESDFKEMHCIRSRGSMEAIEREKIYGFYTIATIKAKDFFTGAYNNNVFKNIPFTEISQAFFVLRNRCCLIKFSVIRIKDKLDIMTVDPILNMLENLNLSEAKDAGKNINIDNTLDDFTTDKQTDDIKKYSKEIKSKPNNALGYWLRSNAYLQIKEYNKAIQDISKFIELEPKKSVLYPSAFLSRGGIFAEMQEYNKAIQDYSKFIELKAATPEVFIGYLCCGNLYYVMKQYDKAIQDYSKVIELKPDYEKAYSGRACAYTMMKQYDKAIQDCLKIIELKPDLADAHYGCAFLYTKIKQYDKAIRDYSRAIELKPDYVEAYYGRASAYASMKQFDKAIQDYSKVIELKLDYSIAYSCILEICIITARPDQFSQWLKQFETAIPDDKLSKGDLITKLYLVCINRCILNEPRSDIETRLESLFKENVKLNWSFDLTDEWLDNSQNGLTPEQIKNIRELTNKVKATQKI